MSVGYEKVRCGVIVAMPPYLPSRLPKIMVVELKEMSNVS